MKSCMTLFLFIGTSKHRFPMLLEVVRIKNDTNKSEHVWVGPSSSELFVYHCQALLLLLLRLRLRASL